MALLGRVPESLTAILVTHEHSDHIQGLHVIASRSGIPVYCNRLTRDALAAYNPAPLRTTIFASGDSFEIGDVGVDTFSIPHDANDPVGYMLRTSVGDIGFLTDLGHATRLVVERVKSANALVLETNYDLKMLQEDTRRPWSLKQRIVSRHGHLSNEAAAGVLDQVLSSDLQTVFMAHLSRDCNRPDLAHAALSKLATSRGANHLKLQLTSQDTPCPPLNLQTGCFEPLPTTAASPQVQA